MPATPLPPFIQARMEHVLEEGFWGGRRAGVLVAEWQIPIRSFHDIVPGTSEVLPRGDRDAWTSARPDAAGARGSRAAGRTCAPAVGGRQRSDRLLHRRLHARRLRNQRLAPHPPARTPIRPVQCSAELAHTTAEHAQLQQAQQLNTGFHACPCCRSRTAIDMMPALLQTLIGLTPV